MIEMAKPTQAEMRQFPPVGRQRQPPTGRTRRARDDRLADLLVGDEIFFGKHRLRDVEDMILSTR
jgi:hypothetical protein